MNRRHGLRWICGLLAAGSRSVGATRRDPPDGVAMHWSEAALLALGTTMSLRAGHAQQEVAARAVAAGCAAIERVDQALSLFRPDSALVRLNRGRVLDRPPPEMFAALTLGLQLARTSRGAFDPTVQPLWRTWYEAHLQGRRPGAAELQAAMRRVDWREVHCSRERIHLTAPAAALTLNGIAQGLAADLAAQALRRHGVKDALIDTGEWLAGGQAPAPSHGWELGIADPRPAPAAAQPAVLATLRADGRAIACSADDKLSFSEDGSEHHIIDPRTGHSPRALAMVVVAAPTAALADALSKPLFMASAAQALAKARRCGVDALVVDKAGRWAATPGMPIDQAPAAARRTDLNA